MRTVGAACVGMSPSLVATVVEDGAVLLDLESKYFYSVNSSAWAILQMVETVAVDRDRIITQCGAWGAPDDATIIAFLDALEAQDILQHSDDARVPEVPEFAGPWIAPAITRQAEPLQSVVTSAFDPSIPLAE